MEKLVFSGPMNDSDSEHLDEEVLERYLLKLLAEDELEFVETHILACEACVERLETLDFQISAAKIAFKAYVDDPSSCRVAQRKINFSSFVSWFTLPRLSLAGGALAACALLFSIGFMPRQVNLTAYRGAETSYVAEGVPLSLHLDAKDLPTGRVVVEVVNAKGTRVWQGAATSADDEIVVTVPRLASSGHFLIRVSATQEDASASLLREYSVQTKPHL